RSTSRISDTIETEKRSPSRRPSTQRPPGLDTAAMAAVDWPEIASGLNHGSSSTSGLMDRRTFLSAGIAGAVIGLADRAFAQRPLVGTKAQRLAPGLELLPGAVNGLAYTSTEGTILVDAPA